MSRLSSGLGSGSYHLFYTREGVLTLMGPSVGEARGVVALAIARELPNLQSIIFTGKQYNVLECPGASEGCLDDVYVQTTNEETLCLGELIRRVEVEIEEAAAQDQSKDVSHRSISLQQQKSTAIKDKALKRTGYFDTCVLVLGSTLLSNKSILNLVVTDLYPTNNGSGSGGFSFHEMMYPQGARGSKQKTHPGLSEPLSVVLPGDILFFNGVCFSLKMPQFPKIIVTGQSHAWKVSHALPHTWSLWNHLMVSGLFARLKKSMECADAFSKVSVLGSAVMRDFFKSTRFEPLMPIFSRSAREKYRIVALLAGATVAPFSAEVRLHVNAVHGDVVFHLLDACSAQDYLNAVTDAITQASQKNECVLVLLNGILEQNVIRIANAPNKFLLFMRAPFEDVLEGCCEQGQTGHEESASDTALADAVQSLSSECQDPPFQSVHEPPVKVYRARGLPTDSATVLTTAAAANPEAHININHGPPLSSILAPFALESNRICYSVSPEPLSLMKRRLACGEISDCELCFNNVVCLWKHTCCSGSKHGNVFPYHKYTQCSESSSLVYTSSPSIRMLDEWNLLVRASLYHGDSEVDCNHIVVPQSILHNLLVKATAMPAYRTKEIGICDTVTGANLADTLPCIWPKYVLCTLTNLRLRDVHVILLSSKGGGSNALLCSGLNGDQSIAQFSVPYLVCGKL